MRDPGADMGFRADQAVDADPHRLEDQAPGLVQVRRDHCVTADDGAFPDADEAWVVGPHGRPNEDVGNAAESDRKIDNSPI